MHRTVSWIMYASFGALFLCMPDPLSSDQEPPALLIEQTSEASSLNTYFTLKAQTTEAGDQAKAELRDLLCKDPFFPTANLEMAYQLLNCNQPGEAIAYLINAFEFSNHEPEIALQIAYTYDSLGETSKADLFYSIALTTREKLRAEANEANDEMKPRLDRFYQYLDAGEEDKAFEEIKNILCVYWAYTQANLEMAYLFLRQNREKNALPYLIRAYEEMNHDTGIALQIGYTYDALQEKDLAALYFREAIYSTDPDVQNKAKEALATYTPIPEPAQIEYTVPEQLPQDPPVQNEASLQPEVLKEQHILSKYYKIRASNQLKTAKAELKRILELEPDNPLANLEMGYLLVETHKDRESLPFFLKAYALTEQNPHTALAIGYIYIEENEPKLAIPYFARATESEDPDVVHDAEEALRVAHEKVLHPTLDIYYELQKSKEFVKARTELERILEDDPASIEANLEMANQLLSEHKDIESLTYLITAYHLKQDPEIALEIAYIYNMFHVLEDAKYYFELAAYSDNPTIKTQAEEWLENFDYQLQEPTLNFYYELLNAKNQEEAREELERVLKINPHSKEANIEKGYQLVKIQKSEESIPYFIRSFAKDTDPEIGLQIARLYHELNNLEEAKKYFELAIVSGDPTIKAQAEEGLKRVTDEILHPSLTVYYKLKADHELTAAHEELRRILKIDPLSKEANLEMAYLLLSEHKEKEALAFFTAAYEVNKDPKIALEIAYVYEALQQHDYSEKYFRLAAESHEEDAKQIAEKALKDKSGQFMGGQCCKTSIFKPWMEFYNENVFYNRFSNWVWLVDAKTGINLPNADCNQFFLWMRYVADSNSRSATCLNPATGAANVTTTPIVLDDPIFLIAVGYRYKPFKDIGLFTYFSLGIAYDLIYRLRNPSRGDLRTGISYYGNWDRYAQILNVTDCFNHIGDLYFDFSYYSRYGYWIGYSTLKEGFHLVKHKCSEINGYIRLFGAIDTKGEYFNNVIEIGPYLEVIPLKSFPIKLAAYWVQGFYYRNSGSSQNPYGPTYTDFRFLGVFSASF